MGILVFFFKNYSPAPLAYTLAPLGATLVLMTTDLRHLWLILSLIMLVGVWQTLGLKDTK